MTTQMNPDMPEFVGDHINLASAGLGARGTYASDEFFAPLERLLLDSAPEWREGVYDDNGKWMDGWESRRRRGGGHDYAIIRLAVPGRIVGFDVDTSHFTGNYPPACRIEACLIDDGTDPDENAHWVEILPMSPLGPDAHHYFESSSRNVSTHLRFHIHPDGGVARLRAYGAPRMEKDRFGDQEIDLASSLKGGRVLAFSNAHYGDYQRILAPERGLDMGDGWETRRLREPGNDWIIVQLGTRGMIDHFVVDTGFFKGNFPESCSIQAADLGPLSGRLRPAIVTSSMFWDEMLPRSALRADSEHVFAGNLLHDIGPVTHLKLNIYPDGGISRLRAFGRVV